MSSLVKLLEIHQYIEVNVANGFIVLGGTATRADYIASFKDIKSFEQAVDKCYKWVNSVYKSRFKA